jgi:putative endonuclease
MSDPRHALGLAAEDATAAWLATCGWRVIARRRRSAEGGEVDLIALDPEGILVGIEVRARRTSRAGAAAFSVDHRRVARLRRTLVSVAATSGAAHAGLRVDLVTAEPALGQVGRWRLTRFPGVG